MYLYSYLESLHPLQRHDGNNARGRGDSTTNTNSIPPSSVSGRYDRLYHSLRSGNTRRWYEQVHVVPRRLSYRSSSFFRFRCISRPWNNTTQLGGNDGARRCIPKTQRHQPPFLGTASIYRLQMALRSIAHRKVRGDRAAPPGQAQGRDDESIHSRIRRGTKV